MNDPILQSRRAFISDLAAASAALALAPRLAASTPAAGEFHSRWADSPDRVWAGPEFWANPLQDWRVSAGRLECIKAATGRTLHVLTRELAGRSGTISMRVKIGRIADGQLGNGKGSAGFSLGVRGPLEDYRNSLIFGAGFDAGLRAKGELFLGKGANVTVAPVNLADAAAVELRLEAAPDATAYRVRLAAHDAASGRLLAEIERRDVPASQLIGNLALVANYGPPTPNSPTGPADATNKTSAGEADRWWFADWHISGSKVSAHEDRAFGPLLFNHYTLHRGILKMTVQLPPLGAADTPQVRFQLRRGDTWQTVSESSIHPHARCATFRLEQWNDREDAAYRLAYALRTKSGGVREYFLEGAIRRDPVDRAALTVADISCNAHFAFPNTAAAASVLKLDPDLVAFTGDQYYEVSGGYNVDRSSLEASVLDVLRKWILHGWTWRELTHSRPSISIPDDHDVYHGNLWGEGGAAAPGYDGVAESKGGYKMKADFVNAVHRMQTAHHPDSPAPNGKQDITGYYGPLTYGGVSFAILADRQYKSAPDGKAPPTTSRRADHVVDPKFDPKSADLSGLQLLGDAQMKFLRDWVSDWRGVEMKAAISQTLFTALPTHHGKADGLLIADYDTNAWPQAARNAAVRELRRVFAFHVTGDQHLPAVVHYGVDSHRDGVVAFASPAVNNIYPRWFRPAGSDRILGDFRDCFGHPMTVLACANPPLDVAPRGAGPLERETARSAGFGIVRFDKAARTITIDCWPLLADPTKPGTQFPGWPVTVSQLDNYARGATAHLPELRIRGSNRLVLQVIEESTREHVYTLRLPTANWRPPVFAAGLYTLRLTESEAGKQREISGIMAAANNREWLDIDL